MREMFGLEGDLFTQSKDKMLQAITSGRAVRWEETRQMQTGSTYYERTDIPIPDQYGRCRRILRVLHDATERKQAELELRDSERRFRSYFELATVGFVITSLDKRFLAVNDEYCRILGYTREELLGRSWAELTHPDDLRGNEAMYNDALAGKSDAYTLDKRFIRKDGTVVYSTVSARCVRRADGTPDYFVSLLQDITERKLAEAERERAVASEREAREEFTRQLIESQEAERRRIAGELHDSLGQNLLLVKNYAQLAVSAGLGSPQAREQLETIMQLSSDAIAEVRRISHDLCPYQLDDVGLTLALEALINKTSGSTEIRFAHKLDSVDDLFSSEAASSLYRVVQECLNNILKHSGASSVNIRLERDVRHVDLWMEDDGRGFDVSATPEKGRAGGLGLRNIAERVRLLGGELKLDSQPGKGTRIKVKVPIPDGGRMGADCSGTELSI
jgi:PAS domain S-box-containing protein